MGLARLNKQKVYPFCLLENLDDRMGVIARPRVLMSEDLAPRIQQEKTEKQFDMCPPSLSPSRPIIRFGGFEG
jgi:hypothetical protein